MFVHDFAYVARSFSDVSTMVLEASAADLAGNFRQAFASGEAMRITVGIPGDGEIEGAPRVHLGSPLLGDGYVTVPMIVDGQGRTPVIPRLFAELKVSRLGAELTQLTLSGTFDSPLAPLGDLPERSDIQRVAEAVVRGFLRSLTVEIRDRAMSAMRKVS